MRKTKIINDIEVSYQPSYLTEASGLISDYLIWKEEGEKQGLSFYDRTYLKNKEGKTSLGYLVDKFPQMEDYVSFIMEVRKEAKGILDKFFQGKNQDIYGLHRIYRHDNQNEFPFLLSFLTSFGKDHIEEILKKDFHFQMKMIFLMFVDNSILDSYAMDDTSRQMMEKEFQTYDLVGMMLETSFSSHESMALFRALYGWESIYDRLRPLLIDLEKIIESKFYLVEERYRKKLDSYIESDFEFVYTLLEDIGFDDMKLNKEFDAFLHINLFNPNSVAIRAILLDTTKVELDFGLMMDKYFSDQVDDFDDSVNQDKLRTFSDPTRFEIIKLLQKRDYYVKEMADALYLTPATLSYHLNQLQIAGFIGLYYEGRRSYYYLRKDTLIKLGDYLHNFASNINEGGKHDKS